MGNIYRVIFGKSKLGFEILSKPELTSEQETCRIVFVHGLHGDNDSWGDLPRYLAEKIINVSICQFSYASGVKRRWLKASKSPWDDAAVLADYLRDNPFEGSYILCGHSEGGIIIAMVLKLLHERGETQVLSKIVGQFLFNSPLAGATLAFVLRRIPFINQDGKVLEFGSSDLITLSAYFKRNFNFDRMDSLDGKCHVPTWAIGTTGDQWVNQFSAFFGIPENQTKLVHGDHYSATKPEDASDSVLEYLAQNIVWLLGRRYKQETKNINLADVDEVPLKERFDVTTDEGVDALGQYCREAHSHGDFKMYYKALSQMSLPLKKVGRHKELSDICKLDIDRKGGDNPYPTLTYSQCRFVYYDLREAFDALSRWMERDPKLVRVAPQTRLRIVGTYCEILQASGAYDLAANILESILSSRSIERVNFKALCQSFGILGRAYLGQGSYQSAFDLCEVTLLEQRLTKDLHSIAIAEMNLGMVYFEASNFDSAERLFEDALEKFRDIDKRAFAWAQLSLAVVKVKKGSTREVEPLVFDALTYYSSHGECSLDYLTRLKYITSFSSLGDRVIEKSKLEYERVHREIKRNALSREQLLLAERTKSVFALAVDEADGAPAYEKAVTKGGFKVRSTIVKTFISSMDVEKVEEYVSAITSRANHFSIPIYNCLLVEVCRSRKYLIKAEIVDKIDEILLQTDSVKLFFADFCEKEQQDALCKTLLDSTKNKDTYRYFNISGNLFSRYRRDYEKAMELYNCALAATKVERVKAKIYNNMAHLIHRHRRRAEYKTAIDFCLESIRLRESVGFWFPAVLMLALRIELSNKGEIEDILEKHRKEFGLRTREEKYLLAKLHDKTKRRIIGNILA